MHVGQKLVCVVDLERCFDADGLNRPLRYPAYGQTLVIKEISEDQWVSFYNLEIDNFEAWWNQDLFVPLDRFKVKSEIKDIEDLFCN